MEVAIDVLDHGCPSGWNVGRDGGVALAASLNLCTNLTAVDVGGESARPRLAHTTLVSKRVLLTHLQPCLSVARKHNGK